MFGRRCWSHLEELWDSGAVAALKRAVGEQSGLTVVYGFGASLVVRADLLIYLDVPKDRGQTLAMQGLVTNLGAEAHGPFGMMYKQLYFVDWPMLNRVKRALLPELDFSWTWATSRTRALSRDRHFVVRCRRSARAPSA